MMKLACTPCSAPAGRLAFFATLLLSATASAQPADLVIQKAHVLTMDGARPTATTVAVRDRRIVYVGDEAGVSQLIGPRTRVVSSSGSPDMTLLPGLQDAHAHLVGLGMSLAALDLRGLPSVEAISQAVTKAAQEHSDRGQFVIGRGWDQNRFSPPNFPDRAQLKRLDEASAGHPVWLRRIDGHAGWANSAALALAGIGRKTMDVAGGRILRDDSGEPTGVLIDNAMDLVERVLPQPSGKELEAALVRGSGYVVARGLTAVHDMGIGPDAVAAYRRLAEQGRLPLRVYAYAEDPVPSKLQQLPHSLAYRAELDRLAQRLGPPDQSGLFTLRGIKLFLDGALGSRGAALEQPYSDDPQNRGLLLTSPDHIELMARWALVHGYQLATHAIGDRAVNLVLDAYRRAGVSASRNARFRIEHTQVVSDEVISQRQLQSLGVIASVQPQHAPSDAPWATQRLGPDRIKLAYAYRALLDSGLRFLVISLDANSPQSYEKMRSGGEFQKTVRNIERLLELRPLRSPSLHVVVQLIISAYNQHEVSEFARRWPNEVVIKEARDWAGQVSLSSLLPRSRALGQSFPLERPQVLPMDAPSLQSPCRLPFGELTVLWDGKVVPCANVFEHVNLLGDLSVQSLDEVWNGAPIMALRQAHHRKKVAAIPVCRSCAGHALDPTDFVSVDQLSQRLRNYQGGQLSPRSGLS